MSAYGALAGRIREHLAEIERVARRAMALSERAVSTGDDGFWDGVALNLHNFYGGVERVFEDIARTFDGSIPSGPEWHVGLLVQMSAQVPEQRPPVISREVRSCLNEYRGFRHVVRNVYAFNLRPARLKELADGLLACFDPLQQQLLEFGAFLELLE